LKSIQFYHVFQNIKRNTFFETQCTCISVVTDTATVFQQQKTVSEFYFFYSPHTLSIVQRQTETRKLLKQWSSPKTFFAALSVSFATLH